MTTAQRAQDFVKWCNDNGGFVSVALFLLTLAIAWAGGLFKLIKHRPRFVLSVLIGPNFACTYPTGEKFGEYDVTRTSFAIYLNVTNQGSAAATVEGASLGYKWAINKLNWYFIRYVLGWCWLHPMISMIDFHYVLKSGGAKFYPFLMQRSTIMPSVTDLYLPVGKSAHGMVYFEQRDAWGGCQPRVVRGHRA